MFRLKQVTKYETFYTTHVFITKCREFFVRIQDCITPLLLLLGEKETMVAAIKLLQVS